MASDNIHVFTDDNFETEVVASDIPVLVDFWAEWCMPCKMLMPTIDKVAEEYKGRVKVGKVDTDANRKVAVKYGISAIPTIILFSGGLVKDKLVGLKSEGDFKKMLDKALGGEG